MKFKTVAILESQASQWKILAKSLAKSGLKPFKSADWQVIADQDFIVLGPKEKWNKAKIQSVREKNPKAWILEARGGKVKSTLADGILPLPVSNSDLDARLLDRAKMRSPAAVPSQGHGHIDPVTDFHTFTHFKEVLYIEVKRARRYGFPLALALIGFKMAKDASSQEQSPAAMFAAALRRSLRDTDFPVQYTKDRVLVLMPHTDLPGALIVGRRILERVSKALVPVGLAVNTSEVSIGISAGLPGREFGFSELVQRAQAGLETAMKQGGDRIEFVSETAEEVRSSSVAAT